MSSAPQSDRPRNWRSVRRDFESIMNPDFVIADAETKRPYECDGLSMYREMPQLVVLPETIAEVRQILRYCHQHAIPVVARGAGTPARPH